MSKTYVFLQARTSSERLFGKVLLPIKKTQSILLLYKRLISKKYKTIVLTSDHKSDDYLCKILKNNKVNYFRGSLKNVRKRFLQCAKNFDNEDVIVRVTGDNLFIDKHLVLLLLKEFKCSKKNYVNIDRKKSNLPYGIAAEVFKLKALKYSKAINNDDLEHVTPPIKRNKINTKSITINNKINLFNERCTCDVIEDYLKIKFIYENYNNTHLTKWNTLCEYLIKLRKKKFIIPECEKIILGTAQFGFKYGINNNAKKIKQKNIDQILNYCKKIGIKYLDTAQGYGNSEKRIGQAHKNLSYKFKIMSKFKINNNLNLDMTNKNLNIKKLHLALVHNPEIVFSQKEKYKKFNKILLMAKKYADNIGISLNYPHELEILKNYKEFSHVQIPFNIMDTRWNEIFSRKNNINVIVRSIFLQGLLITKKQNCPKNLKNEFLKVQKNLEEIKNKLKRYDIKDLLISYVRSFSSITNIIIGIEEPYQIQQFPFYFSRKILSKSELSYIKKKLPKVSKKFINPTLWNI